MGPGLPGLLGCAHHGSAVATRPYREGACAEAMGGARASNGLPSSPPTAPQVPTGDFTLPLGEAEVLQEGTDITCVAWGAQVHVMMAGCERAKAEGISCEIIDLQTVMPWDMETIRDSVLKTGRLMVTHEAPLTAGFAAEIAATIQKECFLHLEAPIARVCGMDTPFPLAFEKIYLPDELKVYDAIKKAVAY